MIRQLEAVCRILDFFGRNLNDTYSVKAFLETLPPEEEEQVYKALNQMVKEGDAEFEKEDEPIEYKIDPEANNRMDENIGFKLKKSPYQIQMKILCEMANELNRCSDELAGVEGKSKSITETAKEIEEEKEKIEGIKAELQPEIDKLKNIKENIAELIEEERRQTAEEAAHTVEKKIDQALARSGSIGSFVQDIQKDVIQYMAIFIAIFSLVNINIGGGENRTLTDFLGINLSMVSSMVTLFALLFVVLRRAGDKGEKDSASKLLWAVAIILWIITAVVFITVQ